MVVGWSQIGGVEAERWGVVASPSDIKTTPTSGHMAWRYVTRSHFTSRGSIEWEKEIALTLR
jgi:hypothetical protein